MKSKLRLPSVEFPARLIRNSVMAIVALIISSAAISQTTVVDIIVDSPDHTTLETAVITAELDDDLSGDGPFTVFAPTDAAFEALPDGVLAGLLDDPAGALTDVLLYHVLGTKVLSTDLSDGQMITTLNGDSITVTIDGSDVYIDSAMVTLADIDTDNGVVHVIDEVIVPRTTVSDIIVASPDHTTLETAVVTAGLQGTLSGPGPFTVFAPTDDAFAALPDGVLAGLLDDPAGALTNVLLYHVLGDSVASGALTSGQFAITINGDSVVVTIDGDNVYINNAMVTTADIRTDNGIVHVIDAVLVPGSTVYEVVAGSEDHTTLEIAVKAAGLQGALSDPFGTYTVFAPTDDALEELPPGTLDALLADPKGTLTDILLYHVLGTKVLSTDLSDGMTATTLEASDITVMISGDTVMINNARVITPDIETDNGVVHVINAVITPPTGTQEMIINNNDVVIYPNPAREIVNIRYELTEASEVSLEMFDMLGKQVRFLDQGYAYEGSHTVEFPVSDLKAGMYLLIINTGNSQIANKVRVVK